MAETVRLSLGREEMESLRAALLERADRIDAQMAQDYYHTMAADGRRCREIFDRLGWIMDGCA